VGGTGACSATVAPKKNTTYWATYGGDSAFVKSTSPNQAVTVHVIVRGVISGFYATYGGYHLYRGGVHPVYRASVTPAHPGKCITVRARGPPLERLVLRHPVLRHEPRSCT